MNGTAGQGPTTDVAEYFAGLKCGAHYTALGDGGWTFCLRLEDGGGACTMAAGSEVFQRATFQGGGAIDNVAQISGINDNGALVVTAAGALHYGVSYTAVGTTPFIASGVVNVTAGRNARAALVREGSGFKVLGWTGDGTPAPIALPDAAQPMQVSANYGVACALDDKGAVYCWEAGGNHDLGVTTTPSKMAFDKPIKMISVGQNAVCGVSFSDTLECKAGWYSSPWLPTEGTAPDFRVRQSTFPMVRSVHAGYHYGAVVRADGQAFYLGRLASRHGQPWHALHRRHGCRRCRRRSRQCLRLDGDWLGLLPGRGLGKTSDPRRLSAEGRDGALHAVRVAPPSGGVSRPAVLASLRAAEARQGHARTRPRVLRVAEGPDDNHLPGPTDSVGHRCSDASRKALGSLGERSVRSHQGASAREGASSRRLAVSSTKHSRKRLTWRFCP